MEYGSNRKALDDLMLVRRCRHVMVVGDLEQSTYENLLMVQGLTDHVTFPTHERGGILENY